MLNLYVCNGNICHEPETRMTQNGKVIVTFSIAITLDYKRDGQNNEVLFKDVIANNTYNKNADYISTYLHKGDMVSIVGQLVPNNYTDRNGSQQRKDKIMVTRIWKIRSPKSATDNPNTFMGGLEYGSIGGNNDIMNDDLPF